MVLHTVNPMRRQRAANDVDPMQPAWSSATTTMDMNGTAAETYSSPFAGQRSGSALSDIQGSIGGAEEAAEPRRRTDDWILDLVDALPMAVKSALPLIGALTGVLMLLRTSAMPLDGQGLMQIGIVALAGLLAGHIVQCCSVGALLLASRVFAAGPAILKGLLMVGGAACVLHVLGTPIL